MRHFGITFKDVPQYLEWDAFCYFLQTLTTDDYMVRAVQDNVEDENLYSVWSTSTYQSELLVRVLDSLEDLKTMYVKAHSKKGAIVAEPKPQPRPWKLEGKDGSKHFGTDGIPKDQFIDWYYNG